MKTISAIGIGLFLALSSSGADINITNIVLASGLSTSDTLLGVTNQSHTARATVQQVIDLAKIQIPAGCTNGVNGTNGATGPQGPVGPQGPPGTATNTIQSAAGTGININTNSLLYTISVSPDVPLKSQVNTFSNNNEFQAGVQFDSTVTVNGNGFMGSKLNVGSTGSVDPTNQFEIHAPGGVLRYGTNGVLYVKLNIDGITITTNSQGQIQALNTNQNLLVTGTTNYVFSSASSVNFTAMVLASLPATGLYRFTMCATECGSVDFDPAGNPEVFTMTYSDRLVDSPVTIPGQNLTLVRDGPPAHGRLDYTQVFQGLTNTAVSFHWSHSGFATVSSPITNIITYCLEKLY